MRKVLRFGHGSQRAVPWPSRICRVSGFLARSSRSWFSHPTTQLAMVMTGGWFKWHIVLATLVHISSNHFRSLYLFMIYHGLSHLTFGKSPNRSAYHHGLSWFIMINITCLSWFIMLYPSRSPAPVESTERLGLESMAPFGPVMILVDTRPQ